jgi:hypothetical protein
MINSGGVLGPAGNLGRQRLIGCAGRFFSLWVTRRFCCFLALGAASRFSAADK